MKMHHKFLYSLCRFQTKSGIRFAFSESLQWTLWSKTENNTDCGLWLSFICRTAFFSWAKTNNRTKHAIV